MKRALLIAALLMLAACGRDAGKGASVASGDLCDLPSEAELTEALGAKPSGVTDETDNGSPHPGCSWMAELDGPDPRSLVFTIWRKKTLDAQGAPASGKAFFEEELLALQSEYQRVGGLDGVGEEAFMGVGEGNALRFEGKIIARKGDDVLSVKIDGKDPAAFEAIAREIAAAM